MKHRLSCLILEQPGPDLHCTRGWHCILSGNIGRKSKVRFGSFRLEYLGPPLQVAMLFSVHMGNLSPVELDKIEETKPKCWKIQLHTYRWRST